MEEPNVYEIKLTIKNKKNDVKVEKKSKGVMENELFDELEDIVHVVSNKI